MEDAKRLPLRAAPIRSLLCQQLPGDGSDLYLHAVRERVPFGLVDVALLGATARIFQASLAAGRPPEPLEKGPDRKRMRTVQRILTGIPDATAMVGPSGEILLVNPPFCALTRPARVRARRARHPLAAPSARARKRRSTSAAPQPGSPVARDARAPRDGRGRDDPRRGPLDADAGRDGRARRGGPRSRCATGATRTPARRASRRCQRDLTRPSRQLEALQASVREADVVRARFWTAAAHELRTPLAIAQSYLEVVLTDLRRGPPRAPDPAPEDRRRRPHRASSASSRTSSTRPSRAARARRSGSPSWTSARSCAASRARSRRRRSSAACASPSRSRRGFPRVAGDREKVERLVTNLVDHSLRPTPRADEVRLLASASARATAPFVRVVDRGADALRREGGAPLRRRRVGARRRRVRALGRAPARGRDGRRADGVRRSGRLEREERRLDAPGAGRGRAARVRTEPRRALETPRGGRTSPSRPPARIRTSASAPWAEPFATRSSDARAATWTSPSRRGRAAAFAARLAARAGTRVVAVGAPPKRILKVPFRGREIDVWEEEGGPDGRPPPPRLHRQRARVRPPVRRARRRPRSAGGPSKEECSAPPRPGVFLEDPLRVLRAARFLAQLPGFRVSPAALPEMRRAGRFLRMVSEERRLVELDKLLGAPAAGRMSAGLRFLEKVGALHSLIRSSAPRSGAGFPSSPASTSPDPRVARALLLLPQGPKRAEDFLRRWKTSREEQRLASRLLLLPLRRKGRGGRRAATSRSCCGFLPLSKRNLFSFLLRRRRRAHARPGPSRPTRSDRRPASLRRILKPIRPLPLEEIRSALPWPEGPQLGDALAAFDLALASGGDPRLPRRPGVAPAPAAGLGKRPPRLVT